MRANHVRRRLAAGEPSIGTWLGLPSPEAAEYVATLGFDWLVVDTEHNAIDIRTLCQMFGAIAPSGVAPMVRIPWNHPRTSSGCSMPAPGASSCRWSTAGKKPSGRSRPPATRRAATRSVGGGMPALRFGTTGGEYLKHADDEILLVLQIEHIDGVERADEILGVPGVDACFIGPNDMAASMGIGLGVPLESEDPRLIEAIAHVRETCVRNGVAPGIHCSGAAGVNQRIAEGFHFCAMASELRYLLAGLSADIAALDWKAAPRAEVGAEVGSGAGAVRY